MSKYNAWVKIILKEKSKYLLFFPEPKGDIKTFIYSYVNRNKP